MNEIKLVNGLGLNGCGQNEWDLNGFGLNGCGQMIVVYVGGV